MSREPLAARAGVQTPTVVVVGGMPAGRLLRRRAGRRLDAIRIHHDPWDTP